jgi:chromosome segregation ATPase
MRRLLLLLAAAALAGCAATARPSSEELGRADQEMAAARYRNAVQLYEEFLRANPQHPEAVRARAAQAALDKLLVAETEIQRLKTELASRAAEVGQLRQEATARSAEMTRARRDLDVRQAEVDRLKADLERLRSIDLRREPPRR